MTDDKLLAMSRWITSRRRLRALAAHLGMVYNENLRSVSDVKAAAIRMLRSWLSRQSDGKSAFMNLYQVLEGTDMEWLLSECT